MRQTCGICRQEANSVITTTDGIRRCVPCYNKPAPVNGEAVSPLPVSDRPQMVVTVHGGMPPAAVAAVVHAALQEITARGRGADPVAEAMDARDAWLARGIDASVERSKGRQSDAL